MVSEKAICPCGSGKNHEKCCMGKILLFPTRPGSVRIPLLKSGDLLNLMSEDGLGVEGTTGWEIESEQMLDPISCLSEESIGSTKRGGGSNELRLPQLMGLSPTMMDFILDTPFTLESELLNIKTADFDQVSELPMMRQADYLLSRMKEQGYVRATAKGNLSRAIVQELYQEFFTEDHRVGSCPERLPTKEEDCLGVVRLRQILETTGLIEQDGQRFVLTPEGEFCREKENRFLLFELLFLASINEWHWGYGDRYPEFPEIQESAQFCFYLLSQKARNWVTGAELGQCFMDAFPMLAGEPTEHWEYGEMEARCFRLRFLERFCIPWGLVLVQHDPEDFFGEADLYKVSPFFESHFEF